MGGVIQSGCPLKTRGRRNAISNRAFGTLLDMMTAGAASFANVFIGNPSPVSP